jgi:hypothetical protein
MQAEHAASKHYGNPAAPIHWEIEQTRDGIWIARENRRGLEVQATSWEEMQRICREAMADYDRRTQQPQPIGFYTSTLYGIPVNFAIYEIRPLLKEDPENVVQVRESNATWRVVARNTVTLYDNPQKEGDDA